MKSKIRMWNDFFIDTDEYIGLVMEVDDIWIYILTENVHPWLKKFGDFYIGFQKEKT
jgi:hypothetical protein